MHLNNPLGIYIHCPFCRSKCPYCDFYSVCYSDESADRYIDALVSRIEGYAGMGLCADTIYFGGGTPSLLGVQRISIIMQALARTFALDAPEVTLELNPCTASAELMHGLRSAGVNRFSIGVQSGLDCELASLGRKHSAAQSAHAVELARSAGFDNISLDIMLGTPGQTQESLGRSLDFLLGLEPQHISAYMLKIEPGTPYASRKLELPDDDETARLYMTVSETLRNNGYEHYEISNFALPGYESRHNMKYWLCEEYLGFGPSAHGYFQGTRYSYPRSLEEYIAGECRIDNEPGGSAEEYIMLGLRLSCGLGLDILRTRYNIDVGKLLLAAQPLCKAGLVRCENDRIALTPEGYLVSNAIILKLTEAL